MHRAAFDAMKSNRSIGCGDLVRISRGDLNGLEVAFLVTYGQFSIGDKYLAYKITTVYKITIGQPSPTPTPTPTPAPITLDGLDQKIAARDSALRLNIRGSHFVAGIVPEFLKTDGSVDTDLALSSVNVVSSTEIQADLFVNAGAALGAKGLRVRLGSAMPTKAAALNVIDISLAFHQGARTTLTQDRVANHPIVVRVSVDATLNEPGLTDGMTGLLYVFNGDQHIGGSPFAPKHPAPNLTGNSGQELLSDPQAAGKLRK